MTVFSPQMQGVAAGGVRRKIKSPYVDMIRGQQGQATQNVLAQRQEKQRQEERQQDIDFRNKESQLNQMNSYRDYKLAKESAKNAETAGKIGVGLAIADTGLSVFDKLGGAKGLTSMGSGLLDSIGDFLPW